ncbi:hypothetical protein Q3V23_17430 [Streptomyces sp. VNUA116]|uniref:hypothetical protein n=1 Tax=Streptomyces sp. VNUA116 TaxID=3062449 RepID=UPI0026746FD3|nr:hypothetical protein [Streptomyces sp. VNUA116]WKU45690.1 hypothetical protein Q3V23_17430 [Streptomyces sp. VNUA116]
MKRRIAAVTAAATAVLVVTGCSSSSGGGKDGDKPGAKKTESAADRQAREYREAAKKDRAKMLEVAVAYRKAVVLRDGETSCRLMTEQARRARGASFEECVKYLVPLDEEERKSAAGVSYSVTGDPVDVPSSGSYQAGTGVMVTEETKSDGSTSYHRAAVRMVKVKGTWLVDQSKDVYDADMKNSSPVLSALMRSR